MKGKNFIEAALQSQPLPNEYTEELSGSSTDEEETYEREEANMPAEEPIPTAVESKPVPSIGPPARSESDPTELLKENERLREERLCRICYDREANIVFVPCGHLATCGNCASAFRDCPVCRAPIQHAVKTFMS